MRGKKRVLIVDDNYETVDFLRSTLEHAAFPVETFGVPSAEEGWLELLQGRFDLAIIDLRLPGMSGSEFLQRIHRRFPQLPTIVMSGYNLEWMKQETAGLTVFRLLEKPFVLEQVLEVVEAVFSGVRLPADAEGGGDPGGDFEMTAPLRRRLEKFRQDTGALRLLLGRMNGDLLYWNGEQVGPFDEQKLTRLVGENLAGSLGLAGEMGSELPLIVQVQMTGQFEVYFANIGSDYFLTLFFPSQSQRARIGTIWVFLQRAIRDIQPLLPAGPAPFRPDPAREAPPPAERKKRTGPLPPPAEEPVDPGPALSLQEALAQGLIPEALAAAIEPAPEEPPVEELDLFADLETLSEEDLVDIIALTAEHEADPAEAEAFWKGVITGDTEGAVNDDLLDRALQTGLEISASIEGEEADEQTGESEDSTADELAALSDFDLLTHEEVAENEAEAFWDSALSQADFEDQDGLSLEEAREKGLLPWGDDEDNEEGET